MQEPARFTGSYVHDRFPDATECCMAVAFRGASWTDPDSIPLMVMQTMLGEWRGVAQRGARGGGGCGRCKLAMLWARTALLGTVEWQQRAACMVATSPADVRGCHAMPCHDPRQLQLLRHAW